MTPERVFSLCNTAALAGWIVLALAPRRRWASAFVSGLLLPGLLALVYALLIALNLGAAHGGFDSLAAVAALFANPWLLLAGWIHYLAFDLFIGSWEARDAPRSGVPHWLLLPCLALTFLLGPLGLLAYLGARATVRAARRAPGASETPRASP
jgi:hypothetical protein